MRITPLDPAFVAAIRAGGPDANGQPPERATSPGAGTPCRNCLHDISEGDEMLILAARPFPAPQPYAETGPVFLHAEACTAWNAPGLPPVMAVSPDYLIKAYSADHRILYGTGAVVPSGALGAEIEERLEREDVAFVDIRSARNNCFLARAVAG
ncbi:DUF1203 domain-containing protein [Jannaschia seohaensis]|uniref:Uncharacterized protein DUF1203 n=1 Tax=Jannaschia seohaensis TaxID=475081 RepID=A0A2Y9AQ80_9RHOB|nr:DUF1203 domain-containing protein [Jannaschia seohaensis]PWJ18096.1 uncharacterized protein DUF1203 [Jannaschia seohaensis]SSA46621.1 Protein of unknown function [Jannaschia seohaensis]